MDYYIKSDITRDSDEMITDIFDMLYGCKQDLMTDRRRGF